MDKKEEDGVDHCNVEIVNYCGTAAPRCEKVCMEAGGANEPNLFK